MRIKKWVDMGQEVEIEIDVNDIRAALGEAFSNITSDRFGEERPTVSEIMRALNRIVEFLKGISDDQIEQFNLSQRKTIGTFLSDQAARFGGRKEARADGQKN